MSKDFPDAFKPASKRRKRMNYAIGGALLVTVVLMFAVTIVKVSEAWN